MPAATLIKPRGVHTTHARCGVSGTEITHLAHAAGIQLRTSARALLEGLAARFLEEFSSTVTTLLDERAVINVYTTTKTAAGVTKTKSRARRPKRVDTKLADAAVYLMLSRAAPVGDEETASSASLAGRKAALKYAEQAVVKKKPVQAKHVEVSDAVEDAA